MGRPDDPAAERPTRARHAVLAYLCGLTFVLYLDRMCVGKAAPAIQADLGLTDAQVGYAFAAFTLAYGLFEVVTGHWGDRYGSRAVLTRIVLWWSAFTALTGAVTGFWSLVAVRFLFGAGEAGALPNAARVTGQWFPEASRGAVRGIVHTPALLGGVVAPPATAYLIDAVGWRWVFVLYGSLGVAWAAGFWRYFRDAPADHPGVNAAELRLIGPPAPAAGHEGIPWRALAADRNVWLLGVVLTTGSATVYTLFSWFPAYLERVHGVSNVGAGWLASAVMLGGALGCLAGGWLADAAARVWPASRWKRSAVGAGGFAVAAAGMAAGSLAGTPAGMAAGFAVACFGIHAHAAAWWGVAGDIGGRHVGSVFGAVNSLGVLGASAALVAFGHLPREAWGAGFAACGGLLAAGAACWALVDGRRPLATPDR